MRKSLTFMALNNSFIMRRIKPSNENKYQKSFSESIKPKHFICFVLKPHFLPKEFWLFSEQDFTDSLHMRSVRYSHPFKMHGESVVAGGLSYASLTQGLWHIVWYSDCRSAHSFRGVAEWQTWQPEARCHPAVLLPAWYMCCGGFVLPLGWC